VRVGVGHPPAPGLSAVWGRIIFRFLLMHRGASLCESLKNYGRMSWEALLARARVWLCATAAAALFVASLPAGSPVHAAAAVPDLSGTYWANVYYPKVPVTGGGDPPLNPAGQAAYRKNQQGLRDGSLQDPVRKLCLLDGIPRLLSTPYPFQIFQLPPGQVTFVHELNNQVRAVPLNEPLPTYEKSIINLTYGGYTSGHYEGDTLVIQSNGFNDQTFLDSSGLPHSDQLMTTERVRKIGNQLEDLVTIHDPAYYTRDFQARYVYQLRNDVRLQDYACGDKHRDLSSVRGVAEVRAARAQKRFP